MAPVTDEAREQQPDQKPAANKENKPVGFFHEDNGNKSSMRLMCFVSLIAAIVFASVTMINSGKANNNSSDGLTITFGFLLSAFAPKTLQKFAETRFDK
jgi:hypothetical protein